MSNTKRYQEALKYEHVTAAGTTIERDGVAKLHLITVNSGANASLDVFNGPTITSPTIALVDCNNPVTLGYGGVILGSGIALRLRGASADITVIYE